MSHDPVDIRYVKPHRLPFKPMKGCLFLDYIIIPITFRVEGNKRPMWEGQSLKFLKNFYQAEKVI